MKLQTCLILISYLSLGSLCAQEQTPAQSPLSIGIDLSISPLTYEMISLPDAAGYSSTSNDVPSPKKPVMPGLFVQLPIRNILGEFRVAYANHNNTNSYFVNNESATNKFTSQSSYNVKFQTLNLALGIKRVLKFNQFKFSSGIEIPFYFYSKSQLKYSNVFTDNSDPNVRRENILENITDNPSGMATGLNLNLELRHAMGKKLEISLGIQHSLLLFKYKKNTTEVSYQTENNYYKNGPTVSNKANPVTWYSSSDDKMHKYTAMTPFLRLYYHL